MSELPRDDVERLVRIETKVDQLLTRMVEDRDDARKRDEIQDTQNADMVKRVSALENWRYAVGGALLISMGSAAASVINVVPK